MSQKYNDKVGIIGLGKLGLPMLCAFIKRGFNPIGYDINLKLIETLKQGKNPYKEDGLEQVIEYDDGWHNRFYSDLDNFLSQVNLIFLIVPTPTKNDIFDCSYVDSSIEQINHYLKGKKQNITVVITSTVNPGDCSNLSSKYERENLHLVYSPEFIALGTVLRDMLNPDIVLLGGNNIDAIDKVFSVYSRLYKSHPEYHHLNFFEAEVAKIAINSYVTTKISYANTIGMFVEENTHSRESSQRVLDAIGGDSRIGRKYFKYGVSFGGPCFPRDNKALAKHLEDNSVPSNIPRSTDLVNSNILDYWKERIKNNHYDALVVIGIAYKPGTDFLEESFMIKLVNSVSIKTFFYDDLVLDINKSMKITDENHQSLLKSFKKVLVLNNYGSFKFSTELENLTIIDLWN
jgi:UDPglucose 6-dehydrogenase